MYEDMYKDYSIWDYRYSYPYSFWLENQDYLRPTKPITAWWYYQETPTLSMQLFDNDDTDEVTTENYLLNKKILIEFYNFRKEVILSEVFESNSLSNGVLEYTIDAEVSKEVFTEGIYYCGIQLIEYDDEENVVDVTTVLNKDNYIIRVI